MKRMSTTTGARIRKWMRIIHRDLSFFFSGVIVVYAVSGIMLNHKDSRDPNYVIRLQYIEVQGEFPLAENNIDKPRVLEMLKPLNEANNYTKHYFPKTNTLKVFLRGGSSLMVDLQTGEGTYESLKKRPLISQFNRLHYNPNKWWTVFSDLFAISLLIITITGIFMNKGRNGLRGRGGWELALGIIIPLVFMFLM